MTAPLPATPPSSGPAAVLATARATAKAPGPQAFALPEVLPEQPDGATEQAEGEPGIAVAPEEGDTDEPQAGQPFPAAPPPAPPPMPVQLMAVALPSPEVPPAMTPAAAQPTAAQPAAGLAEAMPKGDALSPEKAVSLPAGRVPALPTAPGLAGEAVQASPPPAARPREIAAVADRVPPAGPAPAAGASPATAQPTAVAPPTSPAGRDASADSRQSSPRRDERAPARAVAAPPSSGQAAVQMPPFRMEAVLTPPQAPVAGAVMSGRGTLPGAFAALAPDMVGDAPSHTPEVVVELVGADALDVTISAATPESLDRLSAAEPELRHDLARLGAEVEAIRMELRADAGPEKPGPDKGQDFRNTDRGADGASASPSDEGPSAEGRQGERMMRQNDLRETRMEGRRLAGSALRLSSGADASGAHAAGRIDRYA